MVFLVFFCVIFGVVCVLFCVFLGLLVLFPFFMPLSGYFLAAFFPKKYILLFKCSFKSCSSVFCL